MTEREIRTSAKCGTITRYRAGCRCKLCSTARSDYKKSLRDRVSCASSISKLSVVPLMKLFPEEMLSSVVAECLGVNQQTVARWRGENGKKMQIDKFAADRYAVRLGKHPSEIWKEDWYRLSAKV